MFKKLTSNFYTLGLGLMVFLLVFSGIKHLTGWPPFLGQLGIFITGVGIGLVCWIVAMVTQAKEGKTLKTSSELKPGLEFLALTGKDSGAYGPAITARTSNINPYYLNQYKLLQRGGTWLIITPILKSLHLGVYQNADTLTQEALNAILADARANKY